MTAAPDHSVQITAANPEIATFTLSFVTAEFTADDGIGPMESLHQAGDALVAVTRFGPDGAVVIGSGVMVAPGLLLTATHVLDDFRSEADDPVFITFLPGAARAWLARESVTITGSAEFDRHRQIVSDISLVSCTLNSEPHGEHPLALAPMRVALPLIGDRLWAFGFRHHAVIGDTALVTPLVASGLVTAAFPDGRGSHMPAACIEVEMDVVGGMSGGAVVDASGSLVGIVSSSLPGGPTYVTLLWDAVRVSVAATVPELQAGPSTSLIEASAAGHAKLIGARELGARDVLLNLTPEELELLAASTPRFLHTRSRSRLDDHELDEFLDDWGDRLEELAAEAGTTILSNASLELVSRLLAGDVAETDLSAMTSYSVEVWDGLEDFSVTNTEWLDEETLLIGVFFDLKGVIWSLAVRESCESGAGGGLLTELKEVTVVQRCLFRGTVRFDAVSRDFGPISIRSVGVRRRRAR